MTEEQERLAGVILGAIMTAGLLVGMIGAWRVMRGVRDDNRAFMKQMTERADHAMWAAEVDAAREAPGEAAGSS